MQGYVYVILASEEYGSVLALLRRNYVVQWVALTMGITFLAALAFGLVTFYYQTRNLRDVVQTVGRFSTGDFSARIRVRSASEVAQLGDAFNDMADRLTTTIADLRQSEQVRRDLVATISHDLRTPVAAIHGYAETLALIEEAAIPYVHVFPYSERPGTPAARMPACPVPLRRARAAALREGAARVAAPFHAAQLGRVVRVVAERGGVGRSEHYARVRLAGPSTPGAVLSVRVTATDAAGLDAG